MHLSAYSFFILHQIRIWKIQKILIIYIVKIPYFHFIPLTIFLCTGPRIKGDSTLSNGASKHLNSTFYKSHFE